MLSHMVKAMSWKCASEQRALLAVKLPTSKVLPQVLSSSGSQMAAEAGQWMAKEADLMHMSQSSENSASN